MCEWNVWEQEIPLQVFYFLLFANSKQKKSLYLPFFLLLFIFLLIMSLFLVFPLFSLYPSPHCLLLSLAFFSFIVLIKLSIYACMYVGYVVVFHFIISTHTLSLSLYVCVLLFKDFLMISFDNISVNVYVCIYRCMCVCVWMRVYICICTQYNCCLNDNNCSFSTIWSL